MYYIRNREGYYRYATSSMNMAIQYAREVRDKEGYAVITELENESGVRIIYRGVNYSGEKWEERSKES